MGLSPGAQAWLADGTAWNWQRHRVHVHRAGTAGATQLDLISRLVRIARTVSGCTK